MSLIFDADIAPASSLLRDGVTDKNNNEIIIVETSTPSLRVFNMSTKAQRGSNVTVLSSPAGVTLLTTASAVVISGTVTTYDLVELSSLTRQNYTGGNIAATIEKGQQIAGNTSLEIAFGTSSTAGNLVKFTNSFPTPVSIIQPPALSGSTATTIITKGSNWLIGTNRGQVLEINSSGIVLDILSIDNSPNIGASGLETPIVAGLSVANDFLAITTSQGLLYVYNWLTKTMLYKQPIGDSQSISGRGTVLCESSSGVTIFGNNKNVFDNNVAIELDFIQSPPQMRDILFTDSNGFVVASGINPNTAKAWILQQTVNKIRFFDVSARVTSTRNTRIESPAGTSVRGRIIRIIDNGVGNTQIELDSAIDNQTTNFPVSSGKSIIEIAMTDSGINEKFSVSQYNT